MNRKEYGYNVRTSFMPRWRTRMPWRFRLPIIRGQVAKIVDYIADEAYDPMGDIRELNSVSRQYMSSELKIKLRSKSRGKGYGAIWLSLALMVLQYVLPLLLEWWVSRKESNEQL